MKSGDNKRSLCVVLGLDVRTIDAIIYLFSVLLKDSYPNRRQYRKNVRIFTKQFGDNLPCVLTMI